MKAKKIPMETLSRGAKRGGRVAVILLAALGAHGCAKKKPAAVTPSRPVQVERAFTRDVPLCLDSFGNLQSPSSVDLKSQVAGKVQEAHFREGDEVGRGDLLFSIDPEEYQADLEKAGAALQADQVELKLKRETLERNRQLFDKKLISQQDYDTYATEVAAAEARVKLDQANVALARINLAYCSITSPIDGVTGKRQVDPGNIVGAGAGPVLVNIKTVDPLYIDFTVPERNLPWVRQQMKSSELKVEIHPAGDPEGPYEGKLVFIDNAVDEQTGTIGLRAEVANKERRLWPGQYATVQLVVEIKKGAVLVPATAVQLGQKGQYLYVITNDGKAQLRDEISVGQGEGDHVIIEKGVKTGEEVVTEGQMGLSPGATVRVEKPDKKVSGKDLSQQTDNKKVNNHNPKS